MIGALGILLEPLIDRTHARHLRVFTRSNDFAPMSWAVFLLGIERPCPPVIAKISQSVFDPLVASLVFQHDITQSPPVCERLIHEKVIVQAESMRGGGATPDKAASEGAITDYVAL